MRRLALLGLIAAPLFVGCQTTSRDQVEPFAQPNELMGQEIRKRIAEIQFQHREELLNNLLWLVQTGEQTIPSLLDSLGSQHAKVRSNCLWALGAIGDRRVIDFVRPLLDDRQPSVRLEAARTLVTLGDLQAAPMLIEALDSDKAQVRYLCHEALKQTTGRDFGFDHLSENLVDRRKAVLGWRSWWSRQADDPWFAKRYASQHGLMLESDLNGEWSGTEGQPAAPMGETDAMTPWPNVQQPSGESTSPETSGTKSPEQPQVEPENGSTSPTQAPTPSKSGSSPQTTGSQTTGSNMTGTRAEQIQQLATSMQKAMQAGNNDEAIHVFQAARPSIQVGTDDPDYDAYAAVERLYLQARLAAELGNKKSNDG